MRFRIKIQLPEKEGDKKKRSAYFTVIASNEEDGLNKVFIRKEHLQSDKSKYKVV